MMDNWTYRQKNFGLLGITVVLAILAYVLAVSKTLETSSKVAELESKIAALKNAPNALINLRTKVAEGEALLGTANAEPDEIQLALISTINALKEIDVVIDAVAPIHHSEQEGHQVTTFSVTLEGDFKNILMTNAQLEKEFKEARLTAVHYETRRSKTTRKKKLYAQLFFQNVRQV